MLFFSPKLAKAHDSGAAQVVVLAQLSLFQPYLFISLLLHWVHQHWSAQVIRCTDALLVVFLATLGIHPGWHPRFRYKKSVFIHHVVELATLWLLLRLSKGHLTLKKLVQLCTYLRNILSQSGSPWISNISFRTYWPYTEKQSLEKKATVKDSWVSSWTLAVYNPMLR